MNAGFWIFLLVLGPVLLFVLWLILLETSVRIEPGTLGLALLRGSRRARSWARAGTSSARGAR